jgi:2,3-bisphosphoglycerate-independent phosphoglycerate mutase
MKYCVLIIDGASGWPLPERDDKTTLELAATPNLDRMASEGFMGMARTVPPGMEPSSACACMSVLGYDPKAYYRGRSAIEAVSMDIPIGEGEVLFRCNLVTVQDGNMVSYCAGHISSDEGRELIAAVERGLGSDTIRFYPGVGYRHICKILGREGVLAAACTPPHDIPDKPVAEYMPQGAGSELLRELMTRSQEILRDHPVNVNRRSRGELPATMLWLFWGSGRVPQLPPFEREYGLEAALTSGVDLLRGLAKMARIDTLDISGVTDGPDNDYAGQADGALRSLVGHDLVVIHIEAPDEAAHAGSVDDKVEAIQRIDREVISRIGGWKGDELRVLVMPDHPTPISVRTHVSEPVPFLLWGPGFVSNGVERFTEKDAAGTGVAVEEGHTIMSRLLEVE